LSYLFCGWIQTNALCKFIRYKQWMRTADVFEYNSRNFMLFKLKPDNEKVP